MSIYPHLKSNSIEDLHKLIDCYFSKEKETSNDSYRKEIQKIIFDILSKLMMDHIQ